MNALHIDLRGHDLETLDDFWDAVTTPCGLPTWFGRNLDAWWDTIDTRGISELIDRHDQLIIEVDARGLFDGTNPDGHRLAETFDGETNQLRVHPA
ncbi:barstar family protein [Kitasatospora sp. NPDC006697]|uniref:barstar family protein n=1 Tax=Kitasatospora sp. NPDC006697 TaxID=3364020 RepID=UPI003680709F